MCIYAVLIYLILPSSIWIVSNWSKLWDLYRIFPKWWWPSWHAFIEQNYCTFFYLFKGISVSLEECRFIFESRENMRTLLLLICQFKINIVKNILCYFLFLEQVRSFNLATLFDSVMNIDQIRRKKRIFFIISKSLFTLPRVLSTPRIYNK